MKLTLDELSDGKHARRIKADDRYHQRVSRQEELADSLIGALVRNGQAVYYVFVGGRYREGTRQALIQFLIRNKYV